MPETFLPTCDVEFTTPLATVSNTVVRSVSIEQHEDPDRVEKYVRYVAKCQYKVCVSNHSIDTYTDYSSRSTMFNVPISIWKL